ncbi:GlsB/YeaQ/YmgE family stress response membrane protein [Kaistia dalseonensis]|uniref:Membrane protein YeaQ/YmgE (Transglycosylase-associated protein family) n=1 Tax=Kaistia dalseonensis TaxID=410840 RepID=A0ABU0H4K9_9HYPH|nr:GlsB/YeaQ/YmgE family stress response membrane protein [Kaistia dalseonensis]MCX5494111.1 GlsB/YeaQ/YmgE family stress response membrane protein [Kaistia dalseonensis]MDQ0436690.1 putative membrane protein YeaQ/YmgE (transglycosylase-associated protein family) [Kaistia dalseonensis]
MNGVGIFLTIVIGILAGWIASRTLGRRQGLILNLIVGLVGAWIGAALFSAFNISPQPGFVGSLVVSTAGAIVLLFLLGLLRR